MLVGQQIGPFAVEKELGSGAMGSVWLATYLKTGGRVALKVINPGVAGNPNTVARFERETAILKKLNHPNIVRLLANGRYHRSPFYAMEYIEGESLDHILHRRGLFTWEETINIGKQICAALQHAHERGVIHRDLKPGNILMTPDGTAKLADFGIAKGLDTGQLTATNCAVGTAAYMSPEQCRGEKNLTSKSDLYSLGVMLYELLTGRLPFPADNTLDMFLAHTQGDFERPSRRVLDIPIWLDTLVCQCLEKEPERRPVDAAMVARSLDVVQEKVAAQRSVGVDLVSTRPAELRKTLKTNQGDREAARLLHAAIKKTKIRRRTRPFYERLWFQAIALLAVLGVMAFVFWYALKPPSAATLYRRANQLMSSNNPDYWKKAREEPIKQYLKYYGDRHDEQTAQVHGWADKVDVATLEQQLHNRMKMSMTPEGDAESGAQAAVRREDAGDFEGALARWHALLKLKDEANADAHVWGLLAEKRIQDLQLVEEMQTGFRRSIDQAHEQGLEPEGDSDLQKQGLLATRYEIFGDLGMALGRWQSLKDNFTETTPRPWRLLTAQRIRDLQSRVPQGPDVLPTRLALIQKELARATSPVSYNPRVSYVICREIIDLYAHEKDADVALLVASTRKALARFDADMQPGGLQRDTPAKSQ